MTKTKIPASQKYIYISVIIQLILSIAVICWQFVEIAGTDEKFNNLDVMFYFFWIGIFVYSAVSATILICLKKKAKIRARLTGMYQYSLVANGAFVQIASILFVHDAAHDKGIWLYLSIIILLLSFFLTTLCFYIGNSFQRKQHQINIGMAEQLSSDLKHSKIKYKTLEEFEEEKIPSNRIKK